MAPPQARPATAIAPPARAAAAAASHSERDEEGEDEEGAEDDEDWDEELRSLLGGAPEEPKRRCLDCREKIDDDEPNWKIRCLSCWRLMKARTVRRR